MQADMYGIAFWVGYRRGGIVSIDQGTGGYIMSFRSLGLFALHFTV